MNTNQNMVIYTHVVTKLKLYFQYFTVDKIVSYTLFHFIFTITLFGERAGTIIFILPMRK